MTDAVIPFPAANLRQPLRPQSFFSAQPPAGYFPEGRGVWINIAGAWRAGTVTGWDPINGGYLILLDGEDHRETIARPFRVRQRFVGETGPSFGGANP